MGLSNKKEEQLKKMPIVEHRMFKSKNGNYFVCQTITTEIKPVAYVQKILDSEPQEPVIDFAEDLALVEA